MGKTGISMLLASMGFDADAMMEYIETAKREIPDIAKRFDERVTAIERKLDRILFIMESDTSLTEENHEPRKLM